MGDRRAGLCPRQRALSRRGDAGSDGEGAARVFRLEPEGAPHTETSHQRIYCRPRLRGDDIGWVWRAMPSIDRQAAFSGTKEVADALAIDAARLEAFLASRLSDFAGPLGVRQFKGGQSNPTYLVQTPARRYVLRRKPPGKLLPSAHAVDREFRVISALHARGFPVAAPLLSFDPAALGLGDFGRGDNYVARQLERLSKQ